MSSNPYPPGPPPDREPAQKYVTVEKLMGWISPSSTDGDLAYVNSDGDPQDQARAARLAASPEFRRWLTHEQTGHLLVHGDYDEASLISGLSLFCKSLRHALSGISPRCIPLAFYCGLHARPSGRPPTFADTQSQPAAIGRALETGGHIMVRSLIYQLLRRLGSDQTIRINCADILPIQAGCIKALCGLLSRLFCSKPRDVMVWCLVDGVEFYEQSRSWVDVKMVLDHIARHADPRSVMGGARVRLLLTTPTAMSRASELFARPQAVSLAATDEEEDQTDSKTIRLSVANAVEQALGYLRPPAPDPWNEFLAWPQEWNYSIAEQMPITFPGQARGDQLPVSHTLNRRRYYFF